MYVPSFSLPSFGGSGLGAGDGLGVGSGLGAGVGRLGILLDELSIALLIASFTAFIIPTLE